MYVATYSTRMDEKRDGGVVVAASGKEIYVEDVAHNEAGEREPGNVGGKGAVSYIWDAMG